MTLPTLDGFEGLPEFGWKEPEGGATAQARQPAGQASPEAPVSAGSSPSGDHQAQGGHPKRICVREDASCLRITGTHARPASCYTYEFKCPQCGRAARFNTNYLGARKVVCDGLRFTREIYDLRLAVADADAGDYR